MTLKYSLIWIRSVIQWVESLIRVHYRGVYDCKMHQTKSFQRKVSDVVQPMQHTGLHTDTGRGADTGNSRGLLQRFRVPVFTSNKRQYHGKQITWNRPQRSTDRKHQDKDVQTETAEKQDEVCPCKTESSTNELIFKDKKLICVLNRELCIDEEWEDLEQQAEESGMDLKSSWKCSLKF